MELGEELTLGLVVPAIALMYPRIVVINSGILTQAPWWVNRYEEFGNGRWYRVHWDLYVWFVLGFLNFFLAIFEAKTFTDWVIFGLIFVTYSIGINIGIMIYRKTQKENAHKPMILVLALLALSFDVLSFVATWTDFRRQGRVSKQAKAAVGIGAFGMLYACVPLVQEWRNWQKKIADEKGPRTRRD